MSTKIIVRVGTAVAAVAALVCTAGAQTNYTETLSGLSGTAKTLDMVYVRGGTFNMGCSGSPSPACGPNETPVREVTVSDFYIGKYEVTRGQWKAIMGSAPDAYGVTDNHPITTIDWYKAVEFVCELNKKTPGKKYRLATEAEWEFAARGGTRSNGTRHSGSATIGDVAWYQGNMGSGSYSPKEVGGKAANELGIYDMTGNVREWVYDAWAQTYPSGAQTNPTGAPIIHIQKIRRGGGFQSPASEATVTGRMIRSIEGADGDLGFRLAISANQNTVPEGMKEACEIQKPPVSNGKGTKRDDRLITGNDYAWVQEMSYQGQSFTSILKIWDDGTAVMKPYYGNNVSGEWATGNDFALYIMSSSGTRTKYIYYVVSPNMEITLMTADGMPNRWEYRPAANVSGASSVTKPNLPATPKNPDQIIPAGSVVDMSNPPTTGKDQRLIVASRLGSDSVWMQDNVALNAGGMHRYRFDYTPDTARFVVWIAAQNTSVTIASGKWFTIDNTFLRITGSNGRMYDYLYNVTADGRTHYHISFQGYERGDFRMFEKAAVSAVPQWIEPTMAPYATQANGGSTYEPPSSNATAVKPAKTAIAAKAAPLSLIGRTLSVNAPAGSKASVKIVNLTGKTVANFTAAGAANLSLQRIPAGTYLIEARIDGRVLTRSAVLR